MTLHSLKYFRNILKKYNNFFSFKKNNDHLRHQKHKNKQLKNRTLEFWNNFKSIIISINDMDKFEKKN